MTAGFLAWRYLRAGKGLMSLSSTLSLIGMVIGVGSLVVAMAVVSGYETTLKKTVIDMTGHLVVSKSSGSEDPSPFSQMLEKVKGYEAYTPYVFLEAVLAHGGKLTGVGIEGVEEATVHQVLKLKSRLREGEFRLRRQEDASAALVGKGLAAKHGLKIGDRFKVVLPTSASMDRGRVKPRVARFYVSAILDLGRYDFDERYFMTDIKTAQEFSQKPGQISGYRFRMKDDDEARKLAADLDYEFRPQYRVRSWYSVNQNLFHAIDYEKPVIFLVIMVIVIAASFNISSTLLVSVIRRYRDISILRSMGASRRLILSIFTAQGFLIGVIGSLIGVVAGLIGCGLFAWAQKHWTLLPGEVYKIDRVMIEVRLQDLVVILLASWGISLLATLGPARRGAALSAVEGLRYE